MTGELTTPLRTLIVDDEPLAIERMQVLCAEIGALSVIGTAADGAAALCLAAKLMPDLVLLDMTMPGSDGLSVARDLAVMENPPAVIFVTAYEDFAVEAFDLEAIDYVLKPVAGERLERAVARALSRRGAKQDGRGRWLEEFWVPHRSELLRIDASLVERIDAERDYVRLHVGDNVLCREAAAGFGQQVSTRRQRLARHVI